jgi:hypothetical protein
MLGKVDIEAICFRNIGVTLPILILRLLLVAAVSLACLLAGAGLGGSVFASSSGHGLAALGNVLAGAICGGAFGMLVAALVLKRCGRDRTAIIKGIGAASLAAVACLLLITWLDQVGKW